MSEDDCVGMPAMVDGKLIWELKVCGLFLGKSFEKWGKQDF